METGFLHSHPITQSNLGLDENHVIVDRGDWEYALRIFREIVEITKHSRNKQLKNI